MPAIRLWMPDCGEAGVIVATRDDGVRVEFRGRPYSKWQIGENSEMAQLHEILKTVNISQLHCGEIETVTPWNSEWNLLNEMFSAALGDNTNLGKSQESS